MTEGENPFAESAQIRHVRYLSFRLPSASTFLIRGRQIIDKGVEEILIFDPFICEKIDKTADFNFIHKLCAPLYCADNVRPAIDPEIPFRMLFIGYLYGIKSEARLEEVNYNMAYKWFCGLELTPFSLQ